MKSHILPNNTIPIRWDHMGDIRPVGELIAHLGKRNIPFDISVRFLGKTPVYTVDMYFKSERQKAHWVKRINGLPRS